MKPEVNANTLLSISRSKAKMYEYGIPEGHHITVKQSPEQLFDLTIGILGELSAQKNRAPEDEITSLSDSTNGIRFAAHFFDAHLSSHLNTELDHYMMLLGATAYYLSDLPGSSTVLVQQLDEKSLDIDGSGIEELLCWLLKGDFSRVISSNVPPYGQVISQISDSLCAFFSTGDLQNIAPQLQAIRDLAYAMGSPRELLLADSACAVIRKRIKSSTWVSLPTFSGLTTDDWRSALQKETFIRELWPAQRLLGENGVFAGKSAIVQMPTSAGKTKATELIIRSAFLSERASLAVIVAPYRALCHEIHNSLKLHFMGEDYKVDELTDVMQKDFDIQEMLGHPQVIVVTPEKLNYILRYAPNLSSNIGLIVYDEGHLFDDVTRGVTYELLLASLKSQLPKDAQKILVSAVIKNADDLSAWLLDAEGQTISGVSLIPTYRTVGFTSWMDPMGRIEFVQPEKPDVGEYYVPRVIIQRNLKLFGRESKIRKFPEKDDVGEIALYLALKLVPNGSVAIFTGRKDSASSLCETIIDKYARGLDIPSPVRVSDANEIKKLIFIHASNFGNSPATIAASFGIFMHHGNTPHGIRLAVEHALQEGLIKFVICTSTLAQGVNLPLRYLIINHARYGRENIKTRDFHNLIGRAGRSGMHTEGSIVFANPNIYDGRRNSTEKWRWNEAVQLLNPDNSEPCLSHILKLFEPLHSDDSRYTIGMDTIELIEAYINSPRELDNLPQKMEVEHSEENFTARGLRSQIDAKLATIAAIESYLMTIAAGEQPDESGNQLLDSESLVENTLAFAQASKDQGELLKDAFKLLADNIISTESDINKRRTYSQTLFGMNECKDLESWIISNMGELEECESQEDLLETLWPLLSTHIRNSVFKRCTSDDALFKIARGWIQGHPFYNLYELLQGERIGTRRPKIENVIDICENALGFDGALTFGAVGLMVESIDSGEYSTLVAHINLLQRRLKYGLSSDHEIVIFELGFADRHLAQELTELVNDVPTSRKGILITLREKQAEVTQILDKFPSYFSRRWELLKS